jgi:hypothetical protein
MIHTGFALLLGIVSQAQPAPPPPTVADETFDRTPAEKYGATTQTAAAVDAALDWLARHQLANGRWSLTGNGPSLKANYSRGAQNENQEAATAMALLAFAGGGHTHKSGKYRQQIDRGIGALVQSQDQVGSFFKGKSADEWMYTQALCTKALCDMYFLTIDAKLRDPCRKAVEFCLYAQSPAGGWRYRPQSDSDTSVTGWMLLALQAAKKAKLPVPQAKLDQVNKYLDLAAQGPAGNGAPRSLLGSRYAYMPGEDVENHVMTAEGLLCRMHLGWKKDDPRLAAGVRYLLDEHPPEWRLRDVYYWYNATQALFHVGGHDWSNWNLKLRDVLVREQEKAGSDQGSWDPLARNWPANREGADTWAMNNAGGRHYVTCFTTYILEIYYTQRIYAE